MPASKKLQIFVSSTFLDMKEERQAAVESILEAGHIPAGMELFNSSDQTQWEVIQRWIERRCAILLNSAWREEKVRALGSDAIDDKDAVEAFRQKLHKAMLRSVGSLIELKYELRRSLDEFSRDEGLKGWIRAGEFSAETATELANLYRENQALKEQVGVVPDLPFASDEELADLKSLRSLPQASQDAILEKFRKLGVSSLALPDPGTRDHAVVAFMTKSGWVQRSNLVGTPQDDGRYYCATKRGSAVFELQLMLAEGILAGKADNVTL